MSFSPIFNGLSYGVLFVMAIFTQVAVTPGQKVMRHPVLLFQIPYVIEIAVGRVSRLYTAPMGIGGNYKF